MIIRVRPRGQRQLRPPGPTFSAPDLDGNIHPYSEYEGKGPLIINFWGTWCPPCRAELPDLKKIYADFKGKGVQLVSLAVKDTPEKVRSFSQQNGMDWVMLMSTEDALISFNVTVGIPTTIFIDKSGVEKGRLIGLSSYGEFKTQIDKIL